MIVGIVLISETTYRVLDETRKQEVLQVIEDVKKTSFEMNRHIKVVEINCEEVVILRVGVGNEGGVSYQDRMDKVCKPVGVLKEIDQDLTIPVTEIVFVTLRVMINITVIRSVGVY